MTLDHSIAQSWPPSPSCPATFTTTQGISPIIVDIRTSMRNPKPLSYSIFEKGLEKQDGIKPVNAKFWDCGASVGYHHRLKRCEFIRTGSGSDDRYITLVFPRILGQINTRLCNKKFVVGVVYIYIGVGDAPIQTELRQLSFYFMN